MLLQVGVDLEVVIELLMESGEAVVPGDQLAWAAVHFLTIEYNRAMAREAIILELLEDRLDTLEIGLEIGLCYNRPSEDSES